MTGVVSFHEITVRFKLGKTSITLFVGFLDNRPVPPSFMSGLNFALQSGELRFVEQHIVGNERARGGWLGPQQFLICAKISGTTPVTAVKNGFSLDEKDMRADEDGVCVYHEIIPSFGQTSSRQLQQLLEQPA
jgi:hypothetical protein